jgi:hypothetical protein
MFFPIYQIKNLMKFTTYINDIDKKQLEFEVLSQEFYSFFTRFLMHWSEEPEYAESIIHRKNIIINLSNTVLARTIYVLQSDDDGAFHDAEYAWHDSNFFLAVRRLDTIQFIEFAGDLLKKEILGIDFLNESLTKEGASFIFTNLADSFGIKIYSLSELEEEDFDTEHVNIRLLILRMEHSLESKDYSSLLHASASVFETMAKEVINSDSIQDEPLGGFFEKYRKASMLPSAILDYILETYKKRNTMPLAGHGSLKVPTIIHDEAVVLFEMTKAFVRIESKLQRQI